MDVGRLQRQGRIGLELRLIIGLTVGELPHPIDGIGLGLGGAQMGDQRAISSREATGERRSAAREQFCALGFGETGLRELGLNVREDGAIALAAERSARETVERTEELREGRGCDQSGRAWLSRYDC